MINNYQWYPTRIGSYINLIHVECVEVEEDPDGEGYVVVARMAMVNQVLTKTTKFSEEAHKWLSEIMVDIIRITRTA